MIPRSPGSRPRLRLEMTAVGLACLVAFWSLVAARSAACAEPDTTALQNQIRTLELLAKRAELQKSLLNTFLPVDDFKTPEGKVDLGDTLGLAPRVLVQRHERLVARAMATEIVAACGQARVSRVIVLQPVQIADLDQYCSVVLLAQRLLDDSRSLLPAESGRPSIQMLITPPAVGAGLLLTQEAVKGIAGIAGLFRSDVAVRSRTLPVDQNRFLVMIAHESDSLGVQVIWPALLAPQGSDATQASTTTLRKLLTELAVTRTRLVTLASLLPSNVDARGRKETATSTKRSAAAASDSVVEAKGAAATALAQEISDFMRSLTKLDMRGSNSLSQLLRTERLQAQIDADGAWLLVVDAPDAVSDQRVTTSAFRGSKATLACRVAAGFVLVDRRGIMKAGDVVESWSGYVDPDAVVRDVHR
jgi:hypothetical protein